MFSISLNWFGETFDNRGESGVQRMQRKAAEIDRPDLQMVRAMLSLETARRADRLTPPATSF
jgi:hypothetical protein